MERWSDLRSGRVKTLRSGVMKGRRSCRIAEWSGGVEEK